MLKVSRLLTAANPFPISWAQAESRWLEPDDAGDEDLIYEEACEEKFPLEFNLDIHGESGYEAKPTASYPVSITAQYDSNGTLEYELSPETEQLKAKLGKTWENNWVWPDVIDGMVPSFDQVLNSVRSRHEPDYD